MRPPATGALALVAALLSLPAAPARAHGTGGNPDRLVLAHARDHAPFAFLDAEGQPRGILIDFWELWSRKTGVPVRFDLRDWAGAIDALAAGEVDAVAGAEESEGRSDRFDFSSPIVSVDAHVFAAAELISVRTAAELGGWAVGVVRGGVAPEVLARLHPRLRTRPFGSLDELFDAAASGTLPSFVTDDHTAAYHLSRRGILGRFHPLDAPLYVARTRAMVRKGDAARLEQLERGLSLVTDAEREELRRRWLVHAPGVPRWLLQALGFGAVALLLTSLAVHGLVLRAQVRRRTRELRESERRLRTLMDNLPGMAYRCLNDADWTMLFVSDGCRAVTGWEPSDLVRSRTLSYADLIRPEDRDSVWEDVQAALASGRAFELVYRIRTRSGRERWVWERGCGVVGEDGKLAALEGFVADITERKRMEEDLRGENRVLLDQAMRDPLTGLPNRRAFVERLEGALSRADGERGHAALLYVDLDGFKVVNDRFSHATGDAVLAAAARRLRDAVRRADDVSRLGGDEFAVVLEGLTHPTDAAAVARDVVESLSMPFEAGGESIVLGASVGVAVAPRDGTTVDSLTARADEAMYAAKSRGKRRWAFASG